MFFWLIGIIPFVYFSRIGNDDGAFYSDNLYAQCLMT